MSAAFQLKRAMRSQQATIRRDLAEAQAALESAIAQRDQEAIAEARRALAEALERLRAIR